MSKSQTAPKGRAFVSHIDLLIILGLIVVTLAIYGQVIRHQFINLDDANYITENSMVTRGLSLRSIVWAFTTFYASNWHPLTWISHMIDCQLFGLNAGGHLLVNALIHSVNAALVFWLLLRATSTPARNASLPSNAVATEGWLSDAGGRWPSAIVATLFALHPLHVESVAWAAERKDTLSTLFGLLSLIAYVRYARSPSWKHYTLVALALALGLMAKPMLVTWPFLMLLLDYWPLGRFERAEGKIQWSTARHLVFEKLPLLILVALSAMITYLAQSRGGAVRTFVDAPIWLRLTNGLLAYAKYIWRTFWPHDLALYYPYPSVFNVSHLIGAAGLLLALTAFCFVERTRRPYLIVGWLWFLGTLVPVIGIIQVGGQAMADRYHYIPSIGLFTALVFGITDLATGRPFLSKAAMAAAVAALAILATSTFRQLELWRDTFTLFEHSLRIAPDRNIPIQYNLGLAFADISKYDEAIAHFEKALEVDPNFVLGLLNMGVTRQKQGRITEAMGFYKRAVEINPNLPQAHIGLGLGLAAQRQFPAAAEELRDAARLNPTDDDSRTNLGLVLAQLGKLPEAIETLQEALRLNPKSAEAHNNLGIILFATGKTRESIPEFEEALRLNPSLEKAAKNLEQAQAKLATKR
jgi:tetratricopeptide (TPR) repeat protein